MLAIAILKHAFLQIFGNLRPLLHILLLPVLVQVGGVFLLFLMAWTRQSSVESLFMAVMILAFVTLPMIWVAVNWHRYILLNEPQSMLPNLPLAAMLRYIGTAILTALMVIVPTIAVMVVTQLVLAGMGLQNVILVMVLTVIAMLCVMSILLRLNTALPAAAIGAAEPIQTAWKATSGQGGTFLLLVMMMAALQIPMNMIGLLPTGPANTGFLMIFDLLLLLMGSWVYMIISLSILTTLYGHFVENRPLRTSL